MARLSSRVLIEELDGAAAAAKEIVTDTDSDAEEGPGSWEPADPAQPYHSAAAGGSQAAPFAQPQTAPVGHNPASAAVAAAATAAARALNEVPAPPESVFADISGAPCTPDGGSIAAAAAHSAAAAAALGRLADATAALSQQQQIDWGSSVGADRAANDGVDAPPQQQPLIQEIAEDDREASPRLSAAALLSACALHASDATLEVNL